MFCLPKTAWPPTLRMAYIVTPKQYKNDLKTALYSISLSQSAFLMELASRMIVSKNVEKLVDARRERIKKRNQVVNEYLKGYQVMGNDEIIFRWLLLPGGITGEQFEAMALEKGLKVYAAERFAVGKAKPVEAVRVAIGAPKTLEQLEQGSRIVAMSFCEPRSW